MTDTIIPLFPLDFSMGQDSQDFIRFETISFVRLFRVFSFKSPPVLCFVVKTSFLNEENYTFNR